MSQINIHILEQSLCNDRYNYTLLSIVIEHYLNANDTSNINKIVENYRGDLSCPDEVKIIISKACLKLSMPAAALSIIEENQNPRALLLKANCHYDIGQFDAARISYTQAINQDLSLRDQDLEKKLCLTLNDVEEKTSSVVSLSTNRKKPDLQVIKECPTTFNDVGGLANVKKQIARRIIAPFIKPSVFQRFKRQAGGGILLYGPPGCGKTLLARATAGECKATFYNIMLTDILSKWIGQSEQNLHEVFEKARQNTPAILFFDEIEAIAGRRRYMENTSETSASLVSLFLTELDGFSQNNSGVLILGATNIPWAIDNAFLRPGRFDREIFVPPPDYIARNAILCNILADKPCADNIDVDYIAKNTMGYSGADLKHLVEVAEDQAIDQMLANDEDVLLDNSMLKHALKNSLPSTLEWLAIARNYVEFSNDTGKYEDIKDFLQKYERK